VTVWEHHQWKIRSEIEASPVTERYKIFQQFLVGWTQALKALEAATAFRPNRTVSKWN